MDESRVFNMPLYSVLLPTVIVSIVLSVLSPNAQAVPTFTCKCIPGDECWPSPGEWKQFNASIGGRLVSSRQLAAACHDPTYDEASCIHVQDQWTQPSLQ